jgi:hypothetical protein
MPVYKRITSIRMAERDIGEPKRLPSQVTDEYWLIHCDPQKWLGTAEGKWMLFYKKYQVDAAWERAMHSYATGLIEGVQGMKVSTAKPNPRASNPDDAVIIFYCGSEDDEAGTKEIGRRILRAMQYQAEGMFTPTGRPSSCIFWKSESQTMSGTLATGQRRNCTFRLFITNV